MQAFGASARALVFAALTAIAWSAADPAAAKLVIMHGYAELTSATVWIQSDRAGPVSVRWRIDDEADERAIELAATDANDHVVVARLSGLKPGRSAAYRVTAGGDHREGVVRAQPYWAKAKEALDLSIAIGSCFFLADADPMFPGQDYGGGFGIFHAIAETKPDVMLWLGDNLYLQQPDFFDPQAMAARYRRQREFEPLQSLLTATTHVAIWDDHDFGPNDSDTSYVFKGETLELFKRYWPNPAFGLPELPAHSGQRATATFFSSCSTTATTAIPTAGPTAPRRRCSALASSNG